MNNTLTIKRFRVNLVENISQQNIFCLQIELHVFYQLDLRKKKRKEMKKMVALFKTTIPTFHFLNQVDLKEKTLRPNMFHYCSCPFIIMLHMIHMYMLFFF